MRLRLVVWLCCSIALVAQTPPPAKNLGGYRIAGVVYDATSGQTLPGARVSLGSTAGGHVPDRSVLSGPDGSFAFEHLSADKYQMYAEAVGFPLQGFEEHEPGLLTGVVVGPNNSADHLVVRLQRGSSISGYVTDEFNEPVRDAEVLLFRRGLAEGEVTTHSAANAITDDQGYYKFAPLLRGTYFVAVSAHPWYARVLPRLNQLGPQAANSTQAIEDMKRLDTAFPLTFYSGATDPADATGIPVRSGERASADIGLHSVPAITVRMHNPQQKDRGMPFVRLTRAVFGDYELPVNVEQRGDGKDMIFTGVAPGHYLAHISVPREEADRIQDLDIFGDMTIDPDAFMAAGSCSIKGVVQMATGGPPPARRIGISLRNRSGGPSQVRGVDAKGMFSFEGLQPGTYEVSIGSQDLYLSDMAASNAKINGRLLTISAASTVDLAIVLGKGMAEIHGTAKLNGKGLGGTMVVLVPTNAAANAVLFRRDQSDSDGTFTLPRIVPGRYTVLSIQDGFELEWSKPDVLKPYLAKGTQVDVAAGGKYDIEVQVQSR